MGITTSEKKILAAIGNDRLTIHDLVSKTGLNKDYVLSTIEKLKFEGLINVDEKVDEIIYLNDEGMRYLHDGLPERKLLDGVKKGVTSVSEIAPKLGREFGIATTWLAKLGLGRIESGKVVLTSLGEKYLNSQLPTERFIEMVANGARRSSIPPELDGVIKDRSKIIRIVEDKQVSVSLSDKGRKLLEDGIEVSEEVSRLTPEMLKTGNWKGVNFRKYDVSAPVFHSYAAKKHIFTQAAEYIRSVWMSMGFEEMNGPIINTSFWNFDALFVPQDHPARELQDTFYVEPEYGELPDGKIVDSVKLAHEQGVDASIGWEYTWNPEEAKRNVLRTHTTVLSARTLSKLKMTDLPAKFFSVGRVFRNEALDWKHLFEFTQSDGIVVSEDVNFRHLLGYLKEFLNRLGFEEVRFRPHYFPYTEMSVEPEVYHPVRKEWVELGGAGIFRPEVVEPLLGKAVPVLAWGLGVERLIVDKYNITDLREIYANDIDKLRNYKVWWL